MASNALARADDAFNIAMNKAVGKSVTAPIVAPRPTNAPKSAIRPLRPDEIELGQAETSGAVLLDLGKILSGRMLIQGVSGAGKSWTLRRILELSAGRIQQVIIDPEGEFRDYAEQMGYMLIDAQVHAGGAVAKLANGVREHRLSVVLDLSDLGREEQMRTVAGFLYALVEAPREHWTPALVVIDEAHLFAPFGGQSVAATDVRRAAINAVTDLMSRGRKRGLAGVLATQRLARLAKSVGSECLNFLIGNNTLDLDVKRAAEQIGWDSRRAFDRLPLLEPGSFVAVGPAFSQSPVIVGIGSVRTRHTGATPGLSAPAAVDLAAARELLAIDELIAESSAEAETMLGGKYRAVRDFIRDSASLAALMIYDALAPLYPQGARIAGIGAHLRLDEARMAAGLAVLDSFAVIEIDDNAVRLRRGMERRP